MLRVGDDGMMRWERWLLNATLLAYAALFFPMVAGLLAGLVIIVVSP